MSPLSLQDFAKSHIAARDKAHLTIDERATFVNTLIFQALGLTSVKDSITQPLYWDLLCYCLGMVNLYTQNIGSEVELQAQKIVSNMFYAHHYSVPDDHRLLGPTRAEHESLWQARLGQLDLFKDN